MKTKLTKRTIYFSHIEGEYYEYSVDAFENGFCVFHNRKHTYLEAMESFAIVCAGKRQIMGWGAIHTSEDNKHVVFGGFKYDTISITELVINQTTIQ